MDKSLIDILPPELRLQIYGHLLDFNRPIALSKHFRALINTLTDDGKAVEAIEGAEATEYVEATEDTEATEDVEATEEAELPFHGEPIDTNILLVNRLVSLEAIQVLYSINRICVPYRLLGLCCSHLRRICHGFSWIRSLELQPAGLSEKQYGTLHQVRKLRGMFPQLKRLVLHAAPTKPSQVLCFFRECKSSAEFTQVDSIDHGHASACTTSGFSVAMEHTDFIQLAAQCSDGELLPDELRRPFANWFTDEGFDIDSPVDVATIVLLLRRSFIAGCATDFDVAKLWECSEGLSESWAVVGDCSLHEFLFWAIVAAGAFEETQTRLEQGIA